MNPKRLVRKVLPKTAVKTAEEHYRKARIYSMQARHGFPARGLRVVAVTGTNGKTTTCIYINNLLKAGGLKTALITTALIEINGVARPNTSHRTVPLTSELVALLKQAKTAKVDVVILETTSQALHQHKILGIPVEVAVMTNLTQDHLDYHKTMEAYAAAKAQLFNAYTGPRYAVLNHDDSWYDYYHKQSVGTVVTYGEHAESGHRIHDVAIQPDHSTWKLSDASGTHRFKTYIPGRFNVQNATAAICVAQLMGVDHHALTTGVQSLDSVPGRMERIEAGQSFTVLVDYAHTPDALQNVVSAAKQLARGRVLVVFGATGDRDAGKRPIMGTVVGKLADKVFLTDDETYTENGDTIRSAVRDGLESVDALYAEIPDRYAAIQTAFDEAQKGDVVVLAGIGHQDSRNMNGKLEPWDERAVAREILTKLLNT